MDPGSKWSDINHYQLIPTDQDSCIITDDKFNVIPFDDDIIIFKELPIRIYKWYINTGDSDNDLEYQEFFTPKMTYFLDSFKFHWAEMY